MLCKRYTIRGGTVTTEGYVPHAWHPAGFFAPVKLDIRRGGVKGILDYQAPLRRGDGRLVYALPGGGEWVPEQGV